MASRKIFQRVRASFLFRKGLRHIEREEFEDALACFEEIIQNDARDAGAVSNAGYCHFRLGRLVAATEAYRRAVELAPDDPQYLCDLASVCLKMGQLEEAIALYSRASRQKSNHLAAFLGMANAYRRMGGHAEAQAAFKRALTIDPNCIEAAIGQGLSLLDMKQPAAAAEVFERLASSHAENPMVYEGLADAYEALGRDGDELAAREEAARLQPFSARAQLALGRTCIRLSQWKRAFAAFQRALRLQPELAEAEAGLALAHKHLTEQEEKVSEGPSALDETAPSGSGIQSERGRDFAESETASSPQVYTDFEDEESEPRDASATYSAAETDYEEAGFSEAEATCTETVSELIEKGESQYLLGHYEDALAFWDRALELDAQNPSLYNNRAAALLELGQVDEAIASCREAMRLDPTYTVARVTLCEIYLRQGNREEAMREVEGLEALDPELARQARGLLES
ncbi:MAG TPA: tetratricopeptide repeat protein [Candidatus Hydrogenedentes bacterium]|nr:tetratricopeptide repeat protein [Candidatus Hydrogenedentota bacterium]HOL77277.1 tetratricopeptide repeat protein [Candidatus Hydrogenedentota bacterium]HPO85920.1 tetratricopeptide repeat protein [Candidatus Hydrogenedentota bacterium]